MTNSIQQAIAPLIAAEEGDERLFNYVDAAVGNINLQDDGLEVIGIQRDKAGNVVVATSLKLPNLRFRLGELLLEATGSGVAIAGSFDKPIKLVLTAIRFLRSLHKLATLDIGKADAEMLIAIFRLTQEEGTVQVDDLPAMLGEGWDERDVALSLERLDRLACIELKMDGVVLSETIVVQNQ